MSESGSKKEMKSKCKTKLQNADVSMVTGRSLLEVFSHTETTE